MTQGLRDVVGQAAGHLQGVYVVGRILQDGVVGHEVGAAHRCLVEVHRTAVRRVATRGSPRERTR